MRRNNMGEIQEVLDDLDFEDHDELISQAEDAGEHGVRTDIFAEGKDYLGVDDLDRIRRKNLKHKLR